MTSSTAARAELGALGRAAATGSGCSQEDLHGQAELVPGGVEAAEDQQHERIAQLGPGQVGPCLAVLACPGLHQTGHQVVTRVRAPRAAITASA